MKLLLLLCLFFCCAKLSAEKLLIITHSLNRPDFIELQVKTFKKFLQDDYEFVVFNDARTKPMKRKIESMCKKHGIRCIRISQKIHSRPYLKRRPHENYNCSAVRCANVVQYSLDVLGFKHKGIVAIIDSDMFLIRNFSVEKFLVSSDMYGVAQQKEHIKYVWNGLLFFNMKKLPDRKSMNFNCGYLENILTDVGGHTYYYFKKHPEVKVLWGGARYMADALQILPTLAADDPFVELVKAGPDKSEFFIDYTFLHYRAGGNWNKQSQEYHDKKTAVLNTFMQKLLYQPSKVVPSL